MNMLQRIGVITSLWVICMLGMMNVASALPIGAGDPAPEIELADPNGNNLNLTSLRGNLVLVYFWVSWDPTSRAENPNIATIYNKYSTASFQNAQSFELFTVSVDSEKKAWIESIQTDGLPGKNHTNDFFSKYAAVYQIDKLPSNYLIDERGFIIGKNLNMAELDDVLAQRMVRQTVSNVAVNMPATYSTVSDQKSRGGASNSINSTIGKTGSYTQVVGQATETTHSSSPATYSTYTDQKSRGGSTVTTAPSSYTTVSEVSSVPTTVPQPVTSSSGVVTATSPYSFKIQIGAFKSLLLSDFYGVSRYGTVSQEETSTGIKRVLLGDFATPSAAADALRKVKIEGYSDAFGVLYSNGVRVRAIGAEELASGRVKYPNGTYSSSAFISNSSSNVTTASVGTASTNSSANTYKTTSPSTYTTVSSNNAPSNVSSGYQQNMSDVSSSNSVPQVHTTIQGVNNGMANTGSTVNSSSSYKTIDSANTASKVTHTTVDSGVLTHSPTFYDTSYKDVSDATMSHSAGGSSTNMQHKYPEEGTLPGVGISDSYTRDLGQAVTYSAPSSNTVMNRQAQTATTYNTGSQNSSTMNPGIDNTIRYSYSKPAETKSTANTNTVGTGTYSSTTITKPGAPKNTSSTISNTGKTTPPANTTTYNRAKEAAFNAVNKGKEAQKKAAAESKKEAKEELDPYSPEPKLDKAIEEYLGSYDYSDVSSTQSKRLRAKQKRLERRLKKAKGK